MDFILFTLHKFCNLDLRFEKNRERLIDGLVKAIFVYDDYIKLILTFDDKPINISTTEEIEIGRISGRPHHQKKRDTIRASLFSHPTEIYFRFFYFSKATVTVVPIPKSLSIESSAPYIAQMCLTMASPRPVPPMRFECDLSTR